MKLLREARFAEQREPVHHLAGSRPCLVEMWETEYGCRLGDITLFTLGRDRRWPVSERFLLSEFQAGMAAHRLPQASHQARHWLF
jgi:hypothetical protein